MYSPGQSTSLLCVVSTIRSSEQTSYRRLQRINLSRCLKTVWQTFVNHPPQCGVWGNPVCVGLTTRNTPVTVAYTGCDSQCCTVSKFTRTQLLYNLLPCWVGRLSRPITYPYTRMYILSGHCVYVVVHAWPADDIRILLLVMIILANVVLQLMV